MLTCGIPLFLLEVSVGQYLGVGGMSVVGQLCPIFKVRTNEFLVRVLTKMHHKKSVETTIISQKFLKQINLIFHSSLYEVK